MSSSQSKPSGDVSRAELVKVLRDAARRIDMLTNTEDRITSEIGLTISGALEDIARRLEDGWST